MSLAAIVLALVTLQRLGELVLASRNTRALRARGAVEVGAGHYPFIVALHAAWLAGLWVLGWDRPVNLAWLGVLHRAAAPEGVGDRQPGAALDHPNYHAAGRSPGAARGRTGS